MRTNVKICGITNLDDALAAVELGVDALGFVFSHSPRQVDPNRVSAIVEKLPPFVTAVGVFVDEPLEMVRDVVRVSGVSMAQLQGSEDNAYCQAIGHPVIKGFRVREALDYAWVNSYWVHAYLFDAYSDVGHGGTGRKFNWDLLRDHHEFRRPIIVAGGLNPLNVGGLISNFSPAGVDVSSGVAESSTRKDYKLMRDFVGAVKNADLQQQRDIAGQRIDLLREAFDNKPLVSINGKQFLINSLTEQVPATPAALLQEAAQRVCAKARFESCTKLVGEEDKGGVLLAAVSLLSGLPFGIARWYPSGLAGQVMVDFNCEYTSGGLYLNGVEDGDRVIIVDDLISTGGTLIGLIEGVRKTGAVVEQIICVAEKVDYDGVERVRRETGLDVITLVQLAVDGETSRVVSVSY